MPLLAILSSKQVSIMPSSKYVWVIPLRGHDMANTLQNSPSRDLPLLVLIIAHSLCIIYYWIALIFDIYTLYVITSRSLRATWYMAITAGDDTTLRVTRLYFDAISHRRHARIIIRFLAVTFSRCAFIASLPKHWCEHGPSTASRLRTNFPVIRTG